MKINRIIRIPECIERSSTILELSHYEIKILYECLVSSGLKSNFTSSEENNFNKDLYKQLKALKLFIENGKLELKNERV